MLTCRATHGLAWDEARDGALWRDVMSFNAWLWGSYYLDSAELRRLTIGRFVHELLAVLAPRRSAPLAPRSSRTHASRSEGGGASGGEGNCEGLHLYAGHDGTLVPLLCALGVFNGEWPAYGATLALELIAAGTAEASPRVRVRYNAAVVAEEEWGAFERRMRAEAVSPAEWDAACAVEVEETGSVAELERAKREARALV